MSLLLQIRSLAITLGRAVCRHRSSQAGKASLTNGPQRSMIWRPIWVVLGCFSSTLGLACSSENYGCDPTHFVDTVIDAGTCPGPDGGQPSCAPCGGIGEGYAGCSCDPGTNELHCAILSTQGGC